MKTQSKRSPFMEKALWSRALIASAPVFFGLSIFNVSAEVSVPALGSGADKPSVVSSSSKYLLNIAKANEQGYSINSLSGLDTRGKSLVLTNSYVMNPKLAGAPAQAIVLALDKNKVASIKEIRVEGRAADIVLLAPKGVDCSGCSFVNTERVTIATGEGVYESGELKSIKLTSSGKVTINGQGLTSREASLLDIAAGQVTVDGKLDTNMKGRVVTRANQEVKEIDAAGNLEVSNGDVQIIVGDNAFRYHDRQSDVSFGAYTGNALILTDNADIKVGNLHLESTYANGDISIDGQIVANGAWSYVGRYNNQSIVPLESVTVKSNGNITLLDQIIAANKVEVESTNNVYIIPMGGQGEFLLDNIRGAEVDIAAVGLVKNTGVIAAEGAYLSANQVVNEGDIEASRDIYINGKHSVNNQFGGVLLGENIHLKSERKVTNGSLYPYRLVPKQGTFSASASAYSRNTAPDIKVGGKLAVPPPPSSMEKVDVDTLEAYILGQNIKVEANDFINANPYEVTRAGFFMRKAQLDANKSGQVIVSAESTLDLRLGYRFWNMSAIAESWTGNTIIHAPVIDNERYYIWADTYSRKACSSVPPGQVAQPGHPWYDCYKNNDWRHKQYIKKLSPPAHINTGANLILKADSLNNEHSAVEVRNDIVGNVSNVWMEGLSLREIWFKTTVTHHSRTYCTRRIFRKCFRRKTERWTTSKTELTKNAEIAEFPFVFYVDGHIHQGFGTSRVLMQDITFGPYATSYIPRVTPTEPSKPSKYIPIINSGITFFVPNPNFKE